MTHTLYLCYFGVREPLVQTQVLPYLRELAAGGLRVSLLTFEAQMNDRWNAETIAATRAQLQQQGISWHLLPYHKRPSLPATLYDIWCGAKFAHALAQRENVEVLHARAHIAAAMGALAKWAMDKKRLKLVFDIRGFLPEEYTDAGIWPKNGWLYRGVKRVESRLLAAADAFVVLTNKAHEILFAGGKDTRPVEVIPCCVDWQRFHHPQSGGREARRRALGFEGRRVLVYVGSFDGWYLSEEMLDFYAEAHRRNPRSFTLILTQRGAEQVRSRLSAKGITAADCLVTSVAPAEVAEYLYAADVALSFIKPCYSKQSSSPTKIAEYLAAGLPVISNAGIGDLDELIRGERVGAILQDFTPEAYARALSEIEALGEPEVVRVHCQTVARECFDLQNVGGPRYRRLYERLLNGEGHSEFTLQRV
ncbi:MAG TPA: glycosyltransferase [Blastocatellia bacterium]|nr:glycosyltransferase [Blastocatellia bacterium]HMX24150.1 glycosyltransferase [Blastocatellia bacterium]HMY75442.1 glycosyltransferase [Blastocatellia bacterium]HMZ20655.1 glycosyltransferase [Blastocatellia bacterium]HNG28372.1 glycosyltransferase [Blastocatellia bacterium]